MTEECKDCGKPFQNADSLRSHRRKRHGANAISCATCGETCADEAKLAHHVFQNHPLAFQSAAGAPPHEQTLVSGPRRCRVYLRVSTNDQTNLNQLMKVRTAISLRGWFVAQRPDGTEGVYADEESGAHMNRAALQAALRELRPGEVFVITRADRLSRSVSDFCNITREIQARGAELYATESPIDTTSPIGMAFWQMLGVFAELERALIIARSADGRARARAQGRHMGRHAGDCGIAYPCPAGIDHQLRARARRENKSGGPKVGVDAGFSALSESRPAPKGAGN